MVGPIGGIAGLALVAIGVLYEIHANADTHQSPRESTGPVAAGAQWEGNRDRMQWPDRGAPPG